MISLHKVIRAIFILPFSAGHPKKHEEKGTISHDGSISGIVFLIGMVVILCEFLLIESDGKFKLFTKTMMVTTCMGIFICLALTSYASLNPEATKPNGHWDICGKIMLKFLWLFTLASITYSAVYLAYHINCYRKHYNMYNVKERIACDILLLVFRLFQTGFLTKFSQSTFKNILGCYYGLLVLFITNITVIAIEFTHELKYIDDYTVNTTRSFNTCYTNTSIGHSLAVVSDFMDPAVLEYCLLSLLFISAMWPQKTSSYSRRNLSCVFNSISTDENTSLLPNGNVYDEDPVHFDIANARHRTLKFAMIIISTLLNIPCGILLAYRIYEPHGQTVDVAFSSYNSFTLTIIFFALVKCFYSIQTDCVPTAKVVTFVAKDYLILVSFIGSLIYYTVRLIAYTIVFQNVAKLYSYSIMIVSIYFQTVLIFQMKHYEKRNIKSSLASVEYTVLFLSVNNLIIWGVDSFLASMYVFANDAPTILYGKKLWGTLYTLLFPFVVFYRFKCFVAFYSIYHRMKK